MLSNTVNQIIINTGNLLSYKEFKKKAAQSPSEEVFDSIASTLDHHLSTDPQGDEESIVLKCVNKKHISVVNEERTNLKITVKVFLENFNSEDLNAAVNEALNDLDTEVIDSLILSLPSLPDDEKLTLDQIKPLWTELEKYVHLSKVLTIGISDLDTPELTELYNWTQIKPSVNQVNFESCCVMPLEMVSFAKDNNVQLLTHNDPKVLLSSDSIHKILEKAVPSPLDWSVNWIVRYSVVIKSRGIIQNKGYLLSAKKKL